MINLLGTFKRLTLLHQRRHKIFSTKALVMRLVGYYNRHTHHKWRIVTIELKVKVKP